MKRLLSFGFAGLLTVTGVGDQLKAGPPNYNPNIAEDLHRFCRGAVTVRLPNRPEKPLELRVFAYQYRGNDTPLTAIVNGVKLSYKDNRQDAFAWRSFALPGGVVREGSNRIVFACDAETPYAWALAIAPSPIAYSAKSEDGGVTWTTEKLGFDYSLTGGYPVSLTDADGQAVPFDYEPFSAPPEPSPRQTSQTPASVAPHFAENGFEKREWARRFAFADLKDQPRSPDVAVAPDGVTARRGQIVKDEHGNPLLTGRYARLDEEVSDTTRIRKDLWLDNAACDNASLMLYFEVLPRGGRSPSPLIASINGHDLTIEAEKSWRGRPKDWRTIAFPKEWLKVGLNAIVLRAGAEGGWAFCYEDQRTPNRSARSVDGGKTWNYDALGSAGRNDGEYLVRLYLDRFRARGEMWSAPFDLFAESADGVPLLSERMTVSVKPEIETPPGSAAETYVAFGPGMVPDGAWTEWIRADRAVSVPAGCRFARWKVVFVSETGKRAPALKAVSVAIAGSVLKTVGPALTPRVDAAPPKMPSARPCFDRFDHPKLKDLARRFDLPGVTRDAKDELDALLKIAAKIRQLRLDHERFFKKSDVTHWVPNDPFYEACFFRNARGHLDKPYGWFCHDFNHLFASCCLAIGVPARPLLMTRMVPPGFGHCFPEVWSNQFGKWILIDAYNGCYYLENGVPANTMAIHEAQFDPARFERVKTLPVSERPGPLDPKGVGPCPRGYESFGVWPRNNYLERPFPRPIWDGSQSFTWDGRLWFENPKVRFLPEFPNYTERKEDLYYDLNRTFLSPVYVGGRTFHVALANVTPNFSHYEISADGKRTSQSDNVFVWTPRSAEDRLVVRAINQNGVPGPETSVTVRERKTRDDF